MSAWVGLVLGDAAGVGAEVAARLLDSLRRSTHGTAYDIAGQGRSRPDALRQAFTLAAAMGAARADVVD